MPQDIPNEVLSTIFSYLMDPSQKHRLHHDFIVNIWPVRLVCRKWNNLATQQLFRTLPLYHTEETAEEGFSSWQHLINSSAIRSAARRVTIESAPWDDLDDGRDLTTWATWADKGEWPEFTSAIDRIRDLPHLNALEVRFSGYCVGRAGDQSDPRYESAATRQQTLQRVLEAMKQRTADNPMATVIRELVFEGLQNMPLPKSLTDGLLQDIKGLHILIVSEEKETPEAAIHLHEMSQFGPYLQGTFLPSVAEQLVELTICDGFWGAIPGEFNGNGLNFPNIKTLTLGGYIISRRDQFDWVLAQQSLTSLSLHSCTIASHCLVLQPDFASWGVDLRGWKWVADPPDEEYLERSAGISYTGTPGKPPITPGWYVKDLRWETIFDSIREKLPNLRAFSFTKELWSTFFRNIGCAHAESMVQRYLGFSQAWCELWEYNMRGCNYVEENRPGKPEELLTLTEVADRRALESLIRTTEVRRVGLRTDSTKLSI
ncbi:hypothetical protein NW762_014603 [Fusarium torreyae]|uniref:F-box domain-containing protein n=1 Tax=Fusarium torreyae TaxID=1237075 RepID=A0A9W8RLF6_9HYPO|nr:hypothetical protein NW762_014603 [Fusarium torreyae]